MPTMVAGVVGIELLCFGVIAAYLVRAMRSVYGVRTGEAIARSALVAATYLVLFGVAMLVTVSLIVLLQF